MLNNNLKNTQNSELNLAFPAVTRRTQEDGCIVISNSIALADISATVLDSLDYLAEKIANMVYMHQRTSDGWDEISYGEFYARAQYVASRLLTLDLGQNERLLILAPNTINHAIVTFAAMTACVPVSPVSPAYALVAKTFERLEQILDILQPGAIYVSDTKMFQKSVTSLKEKMDGPIISCGSGNDAPIQISEIEAMSDGKVAQSRARVTPDTIAKIMFTSGSTGLPKGVINSHRMIYLNQMALTQLWSFLGESPPNIVDWLPCSHTLGGNVGFNVVLCHGGTLNCDDGKPMPALVGHEVENLSLGRPNIHFNIPAGIEALLPHLEDDLSFVRNLFSNMKVIFVAAAVLPQEARNRLEAPALKEAGEAPRLLAGWGSTETAPFPTCVYFDTDRAANIGLPMSGTEIKLNPNQDKLGLRIKGPNVTPEYWNNAKSTAEAFDEQGFYDMGDAGYLIDSENPVKGIAFDGRLSENFKLSSGTWVNVGKVRVAVIDSLRPFCLDALVAGHNHHDIGLMLVPNYKFLEKKFGLTEEQLTAEFIKTHPAIVSALEQCIGAYNETNCSSSSAIKRFAVLPRKPDIDRNAITDKGYVNQRVLLENWSELVTGMHARDPAKGTIY